MKKLSLIISCVLIFAALSETSLAQSRATIEAQREYIEIENLISKVQTHLISLPLQVRRLGFQRIIFDKENIDPQKIRLIEARLADLITTSRSTRVISMSEFAQKRPIHIRGTDSTIIVTNSVESLRNQQGETDWYQEIISKYQLDGILSGSIQHSNGVGYFLNLQLFDAKNREVIWSVSVYSEDVEAGAMLDKGKLWTINVGAGFNSVSNYRMTDIEDSLWTPIADGVTMYDYGVTVTYRQPVGANYSSMFGVVAGLHQLSVGYTGQDSVQFREYKKPVLEAGLAFYKTYKPKGDLSHDYWIEAFLMGTVYFPIGERNLFVLKPGLNVNLTNNVGITAHATYFLNPATVTDTSKEVSMKFKNIGFGVSALFRF